MRNRRLASAVLCLCLAAACAAAADLATLAGRRVADVLSDASSSTLRFVYSSQLVPDSLRVQGEPTARAPLALAREILAPHNLTLVPVASGIYAVAAATPATQTPAIVAAGLSSAPPSDMAGDSAAAPALETQIIGQRYPYGLKRSDDSLLYSSSRLGAQPSLGEDAMYTLSRQPGMSQGDLSGRLNIRGGAPDETLILFDGFPIREAFHMPGYRGVLSVIDPSVLSEVSVYSGAIPARYGDRMSGVVEFHSIDADEPLRNSLGLGFLNGRVRTVQPLGEDSDVLLAARFGATGYLMRALQPAASNPRYGDALARLHFHVGDSTDISLNTLLARDRLVVHRNGLQEASRLTSALGYYWLHLTTTLPLGGSDAHLAVWLGNSDIDTERSGTLDSPGFATGDLSEHRRAHIWDLRSELQWSPWEAHVLEAGLTLSRGTASYIYQGAVQYAPGIGTMLGVPDSNSQAFNLAPRRDSGSVYLSDTWALRPGLTAQLGLRASRYETPDAGDLSNWDPRAMLAWQFTPAATLRAGWGRVHQVSDLSEIVPGRDPGGGLVGQQTQYYVLGVERAFERALLLRVEAFQKDQLHLLPLQRNLLRTPSILPELSLDRIWVAPRGARIRGVELNLQKSALNWHWAAAYALSDASESYATGRMTRSGDQRHAASLTLDWTQGSWLVGSALNYRSGLPTTRFASDGAGGLIIGRRNADRLPGTLGLDLRVTWRRALGNGTFSATAQVSNLFGGDSSCCTELAPGPGGGSITLRKDGSLPPVPWAGVSWDF